MPRRRPGVLLELEVAVLQTALAQEAQEFHGFLLAKALQEGTGARRLTAHGTLYKALARLEGAGLLSSRWEDAAVPLAEGRPRRRLYRVTGAGELALAATTAAAPTPTRLRPGLATS